MIFWKWKWNLKRREYSIILYSEKISFLNDGLIWHCVVAFAVLMIKKKLCKEFKGLNVIYYGVPRFHFLNEQLLVWGQCIDDNFKRKYITSWIWFLFWCSSFYSQNFNYIFDILILCLIVRFFEYNIVVDIFGAWDKTERLCIQISGDGMLKFFAMCRLIK